MKYSVSWLHSFPLLPTQVRDSNKVGNLSYPEHLFWEQKGISDCLACCLRVVSIHNFRGEVLEMGFVKYLITRAPRMLRLTVKCATNDAVTATQSLLLLPRSSKNVSVVIDPPSAATGRFSTFLPNSFIFVVCIWINLIITWTSQILIQHQPENIGV